VRPPTHLTRDAPDVTIRALTPDELRARADEWDVLVRAAARPSPFLLADYVAPWAERLAAPGTPLLLAAETGSRIVGGLPLVVHRSGGVAIARWVGGVEATPADLLLAPDAPAATAAALAGAAEGAADLAILSGLGAEPVAADAGSLQLVERIAAPVLDTGPDWDAVYEAHVSSQSRKTHRKRRRRLEECGRLEIEVARDAAAVRSALPDAFAVHAKRWSGAADGSTFGTEEGRAFHLAAAPRLAELGAALLVVVRLDDAPIAFQYALRAGASLCLFRIGHDPAHARHSPGMLAMLAAMEAASRDGVTRIELLGGGEDYKLAFADRTEPMQDGVGWAHGPRGRTVAALKTAALRGRRRARRSQRLRRLLRRDVSAGQAQRATRS
jgi:CelD/BcsL family acetyltransferase involved in cellulose biosynthesis